MPSEIQRSRLLTPAGAAREAVTQKHRQQGGDSGSLGPMVEDLKRCPDREGFFQKFRSGVIYWSPATGAFAIHGAILDKWSTLGSEQGVLGYPVTDETATPDGVGRFSGFQGGMIYWTPTTGAYEIHGAILEKWSALGFERSYLGYPVTDETGTPDGVGRFNRFQGGMIYWTPSTGAHEVHGAILEKWSALGFERSYLGYPTSDEGDLGDQEGGRVSAFGNGQVYWWPDVGAIDLNNIVVRYTGLFCHETSSGPGSDEPYVVMNVVIPKLPGDVETPVVPYLSQVYDEVDSGDWRSDAVELFRGKPRGLIVNILLMENDEGDPNRYKSEFQAATKAGFTALSGAVGAAVPVLIPVLAAASPLIAAVADAIGAAISGLFGTGDDDMGTMGVPLTAKQLVLLATRAPRTPGGISWKMEVGRFTGDGANYSVYLDFDRA